MANTTTKSTTQAQAVETSRPTKEQLVAARTETAMLDIARDTFGQAREDHNGYQALGPVYAGSSPVPNSIGLELGVVTTDKDKGTIARTGFGFYLRSDHVARQYFDFNDIDG